ncbi:HER157Cp [Eremothecium sinecaudum]|uniref:HER157Cp n=1 Tax=Eremothecium sinecaudum TaxID=45286 RepID=A0A109UXJ8_9SACH|nr:HER157Cp [Eremothecium sinecaudum]AMD21436.1 HER157Cp [Eremothecium sinecaudum]
MSVVQSPRHASIVGGQLGGSGNNDHGLTNVDESGREGMNVGKGSQESGGGLSNASSGFGGNDGANSASATGSHKRLDLEEMVAEFSGLLGKETWSKYAQIISLFILGKLSRKELVQELDLLLTPTQSATESSSPAVSRPLLVRLHNQLLLAMLTNALRDSPMGSKSSDSWGFQNGTAYQNKKRINKHNSQIETYKKIVMSLPMKDRQRLKEITKETGKRGFVLCSVLQNRLANIPKIPIVTNQETLKRVKAHNLNTPLEWSQEIVSGLSAPLATESYSLPDNDTLYLRMVSAAREHGLVGAVDGRCVEILSLALEYYLKTIVESAINTVRYREKKYSDYYDLNHYGFQQPIGEVSETNDSKNKLISLSNEDLQETFTIYPNLVEPTGAFFRLNASRLINDDELVHFKSPIDDLPQFLEDKPTFTPVDERNMGTKEELNWLIRDILTKE